MQGAKELRVQLRAALRQLSRLTALECATGLELAPRQAPVRHKSRSLHRWQEKPGSVALCDNCTQPGGISIASQGGRSATWCKKHSAWLAAGRVALAARGGRSWLAGFTPWWLTNRFLHFQDGHELRVAYQCTLQHKARGEWHGLQQALGARARLCCKRSRKQAGNSNGW